MQVICSGVKNIHSTLTELVWLPVHNSW